MIISLSDLWHGLKKAVSTFWIAGLLCGLICFFHQLNKPIHYTAKGILKKETQLPLNTSLLPKALDFLAEEKNISSTSDIKSIVLAYPVLENVVKRLNLQAKIAQKNDGFLKRHLNTWRAESIYRTLKKAPPDAYVGSTFYPIPNRQFFKDRTPPLKCTGVDYGKEWSSVIEVIFKDEEKFYVLENKKRVGTGKLGEVFEGKMGRFFLESVRPIRLKKKRFTLTFIPLDQAVRNLQKKIVVKGDKENPHLIYLSFTHNDRHLAADIVNAAMEEYQHFLDNEKKKWLNNHLSYLEQRRKAGLTELEHVLKQRKEYLEKNLAQGEIVSLNKEIEFIAQTQATIQSKLHAIVLEMTQIAAALNQPAPFAELIKQLDEDPFPPQTDLLTVETVKGLLTMLQESLEEIRTEKERHNYCIEKLRDETFEPSSLALLIGDPSLNARFEKMHALHRNLVDEKNWSEREKAVMRDELKIEKNYLAKHLEDLKSGATVQENVLIKRICNTQKTLLFLLRKLYQSLENELDELAKQMLHLPEKWLTETQIELHARLQTELVETISRLVDVKSLSANLNTPHALTLSSAHPSALPDHPKLFIGMVLGFAFGSSIAAFFICLREIVRGPRASFKNLHALGYHVCGLFSSSPKLRNSNTLRSLVYFLHKKGDYFCVFSKQKNTLAEALSSEFQKQQKMAHVESRKGDPMHVETAESLEQCDGAVYVVTDERVKELHYFSKETLFVILASPPVTPRYLSLRQIHPLLEKFIDQTRIKTRLMWKRVAGRL